MEGLEAKVVDAEDYDTETFFTQSFQAKAFESAEVVAQEAEDLATKGLESFIGTEPVKAPSVASGYSSPVPRSVSHVSAKTASEKPASIHSAAASGYSSPVPRTASAQTAAEEPVTVQTVVEPIVGSAKPVIETILKLLDAAGPFAEKCFTIINQIWTMLQPYDPEDWITVLLGLFLIFFGGQWPYLVAAVEAFRICGWDNTKASLILLYQQYKVAMDASRKDDTLDENEDGIADVKQIDTKQLISRKIGVFMKASDPKAVNTGLQGVMAGCGGVAATLKLQFAQTVTLGVSLGDVFAKSAGAVLRPAMENVMPREYHKWVPEGFVWIEIMISYGARSVAVTCAWWLQRVLSALHSAMRGAQLLIVGINRILARYGIKSPLDLGMDQPAYCAGTTTIGALGMYSQIARGFALTFPFNYLLGPVSGLEWLLAYIVAHSK